MLRAISAQWVPRSVDKLGRVGELSFRRQAVRPVVAVVAETIANREAWRMVYRAFRAHMTLRDEVTANYGSLRPPDMSDEIWNVVVDRTLKQMKGQR